jgi:hypothetical protein
MVLHDAHVGNPDIVAENFDLFPDALGEQRTAPVPSPHVRCFANPRAFIGQIDSVLLVIGSPLLLDIRS